MVVTGQFRGTVDFGGGLLTNVGSSYYPDIFVAKFSPTGSHFWSESFGDTYDQGADGAAVDSSDNVVVTGYFQGTVDFGDGPLTAAGSQYDVFLLELAP